MSISKNGLEIRLKDGTWRIVIKCFVIQCILFHCLQMELPSVKRCVKGYAYLTQMDELC